ncbi:MAG TPA: hypothetical protein VGE47_01615, partial [Burkholderiaceae bacterium]
MSLVINTFNCEGAGAARLSVNGALFNAGGTIYSDPQTGGMPAHLPLGIAGSLAPFTWTIQASYAYQPGLSYQLVGTVNGRTLFTSAYQ